LEWFNVKKSVIDNYFDEIPVENIEKIEKVKTFPPTKYISTVFSTIVVDDTSVYFWWFW